MLDTDNRRSLPARTGVRPRPPDEEDAPLVSRETVVHNRHLCLENDHARRMAPMTKQSWQPPHTNRITRGQNKISAHALLIMATALASTTSDPFTYVETMYSPQHEHWKRAMEAECTSIQLDNTSSTANSREARQLRVNPIGSKWVYKTKHNPDGTIPYNAHPVIEGYEQADFGETYAAVGKLTTIRYLISQVGMHVWNIKHLDVITALLNPEVDDDDIYMMMPEGWLEGLNAPTIVVR